KHMYVVQNRGHSSRYTWTNLHKYYANYTNALELLQGVVIVTHGKMVYEEDFTYRLPANMRDGFTNKADRLVYLAPRTKGHKDAAVAHFKKMGYFVIDYAQIIEDYRATLTPLHGPNPKSVYTKPKNTGLV